MGQLQAINLLTDLYQVFLIQKLMTNLHSIQLLQTQLPNQDQALEPHGSNYQTVQEDHLKRENLPFKLSTLMLLKQPAKITIQPFQDHHHHHHQSLTQFRLPQKESRIQSITLNNMKIWRTQAQLLIMDQEEDGLEMHGVLYEK